VTADQQRPTRPQPHLAAGTDLPLAGAARRAGAALAAVAGTTRHVAHRAPRVAGAVASELASELAAGLAASGSRARAHLERAAAAAARDALRRAAEAALTALDVTRLVLAHVDLDALAAGIDVDAVVARADLDAAVARVDVDAVVARVDVDALLARLDLVTLTRSVLEAIDLPQILRESSGAVSSQAARVVRTDGMHADDSVSRWVDRVLRRGHPGAVVTP
jgi:hypothetical protein